MNLTAKVDRYLELKRQIAELENELSLANTFFIDTARECLAEAGHKDILGMKHVLIGSDGLVRVNFPEDRLISGFRVDEDGRYYRLDLDKKPAERISLPAVTRLADSDFGKLFVTSYKPAKAFRELVPKILKPSPAANVLAECTEPSSPRVSTEVAEVVP